MRKRDELGFLYWFVQYFSKIFETSRKTQFEMTAFPLSDVMWQKIVYSSRVKSFREAWQWMFQILADLFPQEQLHLLSPNCHCFCRGFISLSDTSVLEFSIISSAIFATTSGSPPSFLLGGFAITAFSCCCDSNVTVFCYLFKISIIPKNICLFLHPHTLPHVRRLFVVCHLNSKVFPLQFFEICIFFELPTIPIHANVKTSVWYMGVFFQIDTIPLDVFLLNVVFNKNAPSVICSVCPLQWLTFSTPS